MKRMLFLALLVVASALPAFSQYPVVRIRDISFVPQDSLNMADTIYTTNAARWTLQASPRIRHISPFAGDTVTIVGLCVVPAKIITFTAMGFTMLLYDTASPGAAQPWKGLLVRVRCSGRCSGGGDTSQAINDGFLNIERGDIVRMTGVISEFPTLSYNSATQFQPIPGIPITILSSGNPVPPPVRVPAPTFYTGIWSSGRVKYSTGEQYEGVVVELNNLIVDAKVNETRGTFSAQDTLRPANQVSMYDASRYFTLAGGTTDHDFPDSIWAIQYPQLSIGTQVDTIRGFITTSSGGENPRGYRICPLYRGDIVFGRVAPLLRTHRRNPVVVSPDSQARISVVARKNPLGAELANVTLFYSVNNGPFTSLAMTLTPPDTMYKANIPLQPANTFVKYFIKATDLAGGSAIYASAASGAFGSDTSKGFFFYTSLARPLTINDIQYTPFVNGRGAYVGATGVTLKGIVTADSANMGLAPLNTGGTSAYYMQTGNAPWNGLWFVTATQDSLSAIRNGDSIAVTGTVAENFDVTRLEAVTPPATIISRGNPVSAPVTLTTGTFGPTVGNGSPNAEKWEGMLVRLNNLVVTDTSQWTYADPTEFAVDDGSSPILVRRDGKHNVSNVPADSALYGKRIIRPGTRISYLQGVIYYSFNRYKIVPRTNADWGTITSVDITRDPTVPAVYALEQNYPNPFNPTTTVQYSLPGNARVSLKIFNVLGQEVRTLVSESQDPGKYTVRFDGSMLASGVYFYRLQAGDFVQVKKMLLLK